MTDFAEAVQRAAELLNAQEVSGWELAQLTADHTLTSSAPSIVAKERREGRVSAREWAEAVTSAGIRRMSEQSAWNYARTWRKYGSNRRDDWTFAQHYGASSAVTEEVAEQRAAWMVSNREPLLQTAPTRAQVQEAIRRDPDLIRATLAAEPELAEQVFPVPVPHWRQAEPEPPMELDHTTSQSIRPSLAQLLLARGMSAVRSNLLVVKPADLTRLSDDDRERVLNFVDELMVWANAVRREMGRDPKLEVVS